MPICVNGHELSDAEIERELPQHADAANPLQQATTAVVLRHVLLDEARRQGIEGDDDEARIDTLLQNQIADIGAPDEDECRSYYARHQRQFELGGGIEVDHILFQVTDQVDLPRLRERASEVLRTLQQEPQRFAELARTLSNCPSGQDGGQLGRLVRGATVPEFERIIFGMDGDSLWPELVETRFGLHIVHTRTRHPGQPLSYEQAAPGIAHALLQSRRDRTWRDYLQRLVAEADITGVELIPGG